MKISCANEVRWTEDSDLIGQHTPVVSSPWLGTEWCLVREVFVARSWKVCPRVTWNGSQQPCCRWNNVPLWCFLFQSGLPNKNDKCWGHGCVQLNCSCHFPTARLHFCCLGTKCCAWFCGIGLPETVWSRKWVETCRLCQQVCLQCCCECGVAVCGIRLGCNRPRESWRHWWGFWSQDELWRLCWTTNEWHRGIWQREWVPCPWFPRGKLCNALNCLQLGTQHTILIRPWLIHGSYALQRTGPVAASPILCKQWRRSLRTTSKTKRLCETTAACFARHKTLRTRFVLDGATQAIVVRQVIPKWITSLQLARQFFMQKHCSFQQREDHADRSWAEPLSNITFILASF